ncbi:MAG TPA: hypothetical protein PLB50_06100 [Candidatus Saccharicenans sp.]|nr:hypothetical protein [Candidatus Saccharicenans sp.]HQO76236.1 hypothetical protein [Candidatus Saccharicenans sp.]HUM78866.1 hypothetical protein [Candidatus Saccharicenans sp.]
MKDKSVLASRRRIEATCNRGKMRSREKLNVIETLIEFLELKGYKPELGLSKSR